MRRRLTGTAALLALLIPSLALADELTLQDVLESVQARHPELLAAQAKVDATRAKLGMAQGAFDTQLISNLELRPLNSGKDPYALMDLGLAQPTTFWGLTFFAGYRVDLGALPDYKDEYKHKVHKSYGYKGKREVDAPGAAHAGVMLPLLQGRALDKDRAKLRGSQLELERQQALLAAKQLALKLKAAKAYFKWVATGQKLALAGEVLALAQARIEQVEVKIAAGDYAPIDRIENQRAILKRRGKLLATRRDFRDAALSLSLYLRDDAGEPRVLTEADLPDALALREELGALSEEDAMEAAIRLRPEWRALQLEAQLLELDAELARNDARPKLDLVASASNPVAALKPDARIALELEVDLQRRDARGAQEVARANLARIALERRLLGDTQRAQLRIALNDVVMSQEQVEIASQELIIARQVEQAEVTRNALGDSDLILLNYREAQRIDAAVRLIEATYDYRAALATFCFVSGQGAPGCLLL